MACSTHTFKCVVILDTICHRLEVYYAATNKAIDLLGLLLVDVLEFEVLQSFLSSHIANFDDPRLSRPRASPYSTSLAPNRKHDGLTTHITWYAAVTCNKHNGGQPVVGSILREVLQLVQSLCILLESLFELSIIKTGTFSYSCLNSLQARAKISKRSFKDISANPLASK